MKESNPKHIIDKIFDMYSDMSKYDIFYTIAGFLLLSLVIGLIDVGSAWLAPAVCIFSFMSFGVLLVICDNKNIHNKSQLAFIISSITVVAVYVMWFVGRLLLWLTV